MSIALMACLGAGFFAGINASSRDMQLSCDTYLDAQNCFDLEVTSTLGLTQDDIDAVLEVKGIKDAVGVYSENVRVDIGDGDEKVKLLSIPADSDINALYLVDGALAEEADECVVPQSLLDITGKQIGDTLTITETLEEDEDSSFYYTELTITGVIESPLYIYSDSGSNERSTGGVADYLFVPQSNIAEDYITEIYMTVKGAAELDAFGDEYERIIDEAEVRVKAIADERESARYDQVTGDAQAEIDDAQAELDEETADGQAELDDAAQQLNDAQDEVDSGQAELDASRAEAESEFASAQAQIDDAESELADARATYSTQATAANAQRKQLVAQRAEVEETLASLQTQRTETQQTLTDLLAQRESVQAQLAELQAQRAEAEETLAALQEQRPQLAEAVEQYQAAIDELTTQLEQAQQSRDQLAEAGMDTTELDAQIEQLNTQLTTLAETHSSYELQLNQLDAGIAEAEDGLDQLDDGIAQAEDGLDQLDDGIAQAEDGLDQLDAGIAEAEDGLTQIDVAIAAIDSGLESGSAQIAAAASEIASARQELSSSKASVYAQLEEAAQELADGQIEIDDGWAELAIQQADFEKLIADAQAELDEAREEVGNINRPTWYVLTRDGNSGLSSFIQDSENLKKLGFTFPLIFFLVAVLISLSSMTRMVEEQRGLIGTLKALGYSGGQIAGKYLIYAATASVLGSIVGELIGFKTLPLIIWNIYKSFYFLPEFYLPLDAFYGIIGLVVCAGCIIAATAASCWQEVRQTPAHLMRPKAPNPGKRVLIERITPLWRWLNFSHKVTLRNLFRYKKRLFMTICGIAGCAALVTTGFGLRDSIAVLSPLQYDDVMHYDMIAVADSNLTDDEFDELTEDMQADEAVDSCLSIYANSVTIVTEDGSTKEMEMFVPSDTEEFAKYISLLDTQSGEELTLSGDELMLTEQIAEQLGVSAGDTITLQREDNTKAEVTVGAIVSNYLSHYVFLSPEGYEAAYGETAQGNAYVIKTVELSDEEDDAFASRLNQDTRFSAVSSMRAARESVNEKLGLLNQVVAVLIIAAAALAIVVLYSLSNINISERIRELATIKVLGFYDMEVYQYNTRETVILTLIGTAIGLVGGRWLTSFILLTMAMQGIMFAPTVAPVSYVISAVITIVFATAVNFMSYFSLKKIDMVEALKSVE